MTQPISPIISAADLLNLYKSDSTVLIDARSGAEARQKYLHEHLKGALFVDLEKQLADIKPNLAQGGRHPLPGVEEFANLVGQLGISENSHVVVYDDKNGANAAARFWWMLRSLGHRNVQVLDGGYEAGKNAGVPTAAGEEHNATTKPYKTNDWHLPAVSLEEVERAAGDASFAVIDVREKMRYDGESEPIDLIAGHIPGAINFPFTNNLDEKGFFLPPEELKRRFTEFLKGKSGEKVIVHCGSGVTACHTILAMDAAGLTIAKLYTGSWSEWSRNNKPVATSGAQ